MPNKNLTTNIDVEDRSINNIDIFGAFHQHFIFELQKWANCPPSDNLWFIRIEPHNNGKLNPKNMGMSNLFDNIRLVNYQWRYADNWYVNKNINDSISFIDQFNFPAQNGADGGIFLAQNITIAHNSVNINENVHNSLIGQSGWITYGKAITNKNNSLSANISFLVSNYEIQDIFFDRWIAAIGQQGLIEDSRLPNIKADITLYCYAASAPMMNTLKPQYRLRKTVKLIKAFPIKRDQESKKYDFSDAGKFKTQNVEFKFENYQIEYHTHDMGDIFQSEMTKYSNIDPDWFGGAG